MRRTNLIPQALFNAQSRFTFRTRGEYYFFLICVSIFSLFFILEIFYLFGIGFFSYQNKYYNNRLVVLTRQLNENTKARENIGSQIKNWRQKVNLIKEKTEFLKKETKQDIRWSEILEKINNLKPPRLWLVKLSLTKDMIKLKGNTEDNLLISTFISNLSNSGFFTGVTLNYTQKIKMGESIEGAGAPEVIEFGIDCQFVGAPGHEAPDEPGKALDGENK